MIRGSPDRQGFPRERYHDHGKLVRGWYYGPVTITSAAQDTYLDRQWVDAGAGPKADSDTIPADFSGTVTPKSKSVDLAGNTADWRIDEWQQKYEKLLKATDFVKVLCAEYSKDAYQTRNEWMVNHSSRVIAVYDGKAEGTRNTIQYAWKNHVPVKYLKG